MNEGECKTFIINQSINLINQNTLWYFEDNYFHQQFKKLIFWQPVYMRKLLGFESLQNGCNNFNYFNSCWNPEKYLFIN